GAGGCRETRRGLRVMAYALARVMTTVKEKTTPAPQCAAASRCGAPIAEYASISTCHTGALIAPDGAVDWLCVPGFDSASAFGSPLDRKARDLKLTRVA